MSKASSDNTRYREVKRRSVAPYYVVAVSWILFAMLFPMYKPGHFITIILISIAELVILNKLIKPRVERIPLPYEAPRSGVEEVDRTIDVGADFIQRFEALAAELEKLNPSLAAKLTEIRDVMAQIFEYVAKNPDKLPRIRRFLNHYLPTLEKLASTYIELSSQRVKGENITKTLSGIESILDTVKPAFERLLNDLYEDSAIDVSADITVLETMLENEGLSSASATPDEKTEL